MEDVEEDVEKEERLRKWIRSERKGREVESEGMGKDSRGCRGGKERG